MKLTPKGKCRSLLRKFVKCFKTFVPLSLNLSTPLNESKQADEPVDGHEVPPEGVVDEVERVELGVGGEAEASCQAVLEVLGRNSTHSEIKEMLKNLYT
jgi:hypothetical protein